MSEMSRQGIFSFYVRIKMYPKYYSIKIENVKQTINDSYNSNREYEYLTTRTIISC